MDFLKRIDNYKERLKVAVDNIDPIILNEMINKILQARDEQKQIFFMGNGGSGASASHIVGDLNKGLSLGKTCGKRAFFARFSLWKTPYYGRMNQLYNSLR